MGLLPELVDLVGEQVQWDVEVALVCHEVSTLFRRKNILDKLCQDRELVEYCFELACIEEDIPVLEWLKDFYCIRRMDITYLYCILLQGGKEKTVRWLYDDLPRWYISPRDGYLRYALCSRNLYLVLLHYCNNTMDDIIQVVQTNDVELLKGVIAKNGGDWNIEWCIADEGPFPASPEMYNYLKTELKAGPECLHRLRLVNLACKKTFP